jgi:fluoride exporter
MLVIGLVGAGAFVGANARYLLGQWAAERFGSGFPYGTLAINLLGSLLIGAFLGLSGTPLEPSGSWRLLIVTGLLGGFTTFSAFSYETYALLSLGRWAEALLYVAASVLLGLLATAGGVGLARLAT